MPEGHIDFEKRTVKDVRMGHIFTRSLLLGFLLAGLVLQALGQDSAGKEYLDIADPRAASVLYSRLPKLTTPVAVSERYKLHELLIEPLGGNISPLRKPELTAARERAIQKDNESFTATTLRLTGTGTLLVGAPLAAKSDSVTLPILTRSDDGGIAGAAFAILCLRRGPRQRPSDAGYAIASSDQLPFSPIIDFTAAVSNSNFESRACVARLFVLLTASGKHGLPKQIELSRAAAESVFEAPKSRVGWEVKATVFLHALGIYPTDRIGYFQYPAFEVTRLVLKSATGAVIADVNYPETGRMPPPPWQK